MTTHPNAEGFWMKDAARARKDDIRLVTQLFQDLAAQTLESGRWVDSRVKFKAIRLLADTLIKHQQRAPAALKRAVHNLQKAEDKVTAGAPLDERLAFQAKAHLPTRRRSFFRRKPR